MIITIRKERCYIGGWNFIDKKGMTFGKLTAEEYLGKGLWRCSCECGNETIVHSDKLPMPGSKRRGTKSCGCGIGKLNKNNNFFSKLDTQEKAYITGLIATDGSIRDSGSSYEISLALKSSDKDILEKVKKAIESKSEIRIKRGTANLPQGGTSDYELSVLRIYNKQMVKDLESLGITPNKSLTLDFDYSKLPIELFPHFLRGLIDGDGDFNLYHRNNRNHPHIGLIGSKHLIHSTKEMLQKVFPDMSIMTCHAIGCHENIWRLSIHNMKDFKKLLNYIYQDATIFLDRKYENYLRISEEEIFKNCKI